MTRITPDADQLEPKYDILTTWPPRGWTSLAAAALPPSTLRVSPEAGVGRASCWRLSISDKGSRDKRNKRVSYWAWKSTQLLSELSKVKIYCSNIIFLITFRFLIWCNRGNIRKVLPLISENVVLCHEVHHDHVRRNIVLKSQIGQSKSQTSKDFITCLSLFNLYLKCILVPFNF